MIKPAIVGDLTSVKGSYQTPQGVVMSEWNKIPGGPLRLDVTIPGNSNAIIFVPAGVTDTVTGGAGAQLLRREIGYAVYSAGPGSYQFVTSPPA